MAVVESITLDQLILWANQRSRDMRRLDNRVPFKRCRVAVISDTKENFSSASSPDGQAWPKIKMRIYGGNRPLQNTGLLRGSATAQGRGYVEEMTDTRLSMSTIDERAATHQYGAVIRPKRAKMLSIPLTKEAMRVGGARHFPRKLGILKTKTGTLLLAEKPPGKPSIFHYLLKESVTIPARPFMGFGKRLLDKVTRIFADWIGERL